MATVHLVELPMTSKTSPMLKPSLCAMLRCLCSLQLPLRLLFPVAMAAPYLSCASSGVLLLHALLLLDSLPALLLQAAVQSNLSLINLW